LTRLERYLTDWGVKKNVLARRAGVSRAHLLRLRNGTAEPTRDLMVRLANAATDMRNRRVFIVEMFELTETEELMAGLLSMAKLILASTPNRGRRRS
jgi:predicted transcriptional regulator